MPNLIATGPVRGLVGGQSRHLERLAEIAERLGIGFLHVEIGRQPGERSRRDVAARMLRDYRTWWRALRRTGPRDGGGPTLAHVNSSVQTASLLRDGVFVLLARAARVPVVYQVHGCNLEGPDDRQPLLRALARAVCACATRVVVLSRAQASAIGGRAASAAVVIPNAVPIAPLDASAPNDGDPDPGNDGAARLLFLGRLVETKGVLVGLDAVALLARRGVDVTLTVAGDGPLAATLPERIAALGLAARVRLAGAVPPAAVRDLLLAHDLMWAPSQVAEGQPYSVIESLEAGLPVLATRAGATMAEMIDEAGGDRGGLVPVAGDAAALADATAAIVAAPARLQALKHAARATAQRRYGVEAVMPLWQDAWRAGDPVGPP